MRVVGMGVLIALSVGGCQTTGSYNVSTTQAVSKLPPACEYRATFPERTHFTEVEPPASLGGTQTAMFSGYGNGRHYQMACACKDTLNPAMFDKAMADKFVTDTLGGKAKPKNVRYALGSTPKTIDYDYEGMTFGGNATGSAKAIITGRCLEYFMIIGQTIDDSEYAKFIDSIRPASQPASQPQHTTTVPKIDSAEDRLTSLKSLYDRGLITKDEYDKKRKAIVDTM